MGTSVTPMMAQWQACKAQAKDSLLFFRLGDFYEAFYEDAQTIAKELELTLTSRQGIPMCGVPFHAVESYLDKLIGRGYKLAIAEQTEDAKTTKGLVKREIVRILSPGTLLSSQLLNAKKNNYIASVTQLGSTLGLSFLDLTTGEFSSLELSQIQDLMDELYRLRPAEFLVSQKFQSTYPSFFKELSVAYPFLINEWEEWKFEVNLAAQNLMSHFRVQTLDAFGLKGQFAAISAAGSLLTYLKEELSLRLEHVTTLFNHSLSQFMNIDRATVRNLELVESLADGSTRYTLLELLDFTETPMGGRLLAQWLKYPLLSLSDIQERHTAVEEILSKKEPAQSIRSSLHHIRDLERLASRISSQCATPRDLVSLGQSLLQIPAIKKELSLLTASSLLETSCANLCDLSLLAHKLDCALHENPPLRPGEGGLFKEKYCPELDKLRNLCKESIHWVTEYQNGLRETTNIKTLKISYTRAFGYYIEVSRAQSGRVPSSFERRQTLVNAERYTTQELKNFETQILTAEEKSKAREIELFENLCKEVALELASIRTLAKALARIDCLLSLAWAAKQHRFTRPEIDESSTLNIQGGRHPIVEKVIGTAHFIPNDTHLSLDTHHLLLLTGPNMAGKSTYIRQVALISILAQMGSYVPADSAHIGLIDKTFSRIGASDDLARGQSTFMVEMSETANILNHATSRSLIILDEIGRGTSTSDGISIAWAVAEFLLTTPGKMAKTLFATHYAELTELEPQFPRAKNMHMAVKEHKGGITFLRKLIAGGTDRSYGIHVAKLAGLPSRLISRAEKMLQSLQENKNLSQAPLEQLSLFTPIIHHPILEKLKEIDICNTTPLEALQILAKYKETLNLH